MVLANPTVRKQEECSKDYRLRYDYQDRRCIEEPAQCKYKQRNKHAYFGAALNRSKKIPVRPRLSISLTLSVEPCYVGTFLLRWSPRHNPCRPSIHATHSVRRHCRKPRLYSDHHEHIAFPQEFSLYATMTTTTTITTPNPPSIVAAPMAHAVSSEMIPPSTSASVTSGTVLAATRASTSERSWVREGWRRTPQVSRFCQKKWKSTLCCSQRPSRPNSSKNPLIFQKVSKNSSPLGVTP